MGCGCDGVGSAVTCGSGSRMSAPSPRPSAFLSISDYLLGQLGIPLSAPAMNVIENNRLTKTRSFREPYIPRDDALKYLRSKEAAKVSGHLPGERCALIVHRQQYSFDL